VIVKPFVVRVSVRQGSVSSPLFFIIVLEALSREFRTGLTMELPYADDIVLLVDMEELWWTRFRNVKRVWRAKDSE